MSEDKPKKGGLNSLQDALRTTFVFIRVIMFLLVIAFVFSGVRTIEKNEKAVVLQFGKLKSTFDSNSRFVFAWPYPFDSVISIKTSSSRSLKSLRFTPKENPGDKIIKTVANTSLIPGEDGYLITADLNLLHCESTLRYTIADLPKYLFDSQDFEKLLLQLVDSSVLQSVAERNIDKARNQKEITQATLSRLNKRITELQLGIEVLSIELKISFPAQIREETIAVSQASNEAARLQSEAELYARKTLNEAESSAAKVVTQADIDTTDLRARSEALMKTFLSLKGLYDKAPNMTQELLLREKMASILPDLEAVYLTNPDNTQLRLAMPRRPLQKKGEIKK